MIINDRRRGQVPIPFGDVINAGNSTMIIIRQAVSCPKINRLSVGAVRSLFIVATIATVSSARANPPAIPASEFPRIARAISSDDPKTQREGLRSLEMLVSPGDEKLVAIIPRVITLTDSRNKSVRETAVGALEGLAFLEGADKHAAAMVKIWGRSLADNNETVRLVAIHALGRFVRARRNALAGPHLITALADAKPGLRAYAASWFADAAPYPAAIDPLIKLLKDDNAYVRRQAANALRGQSKIAKKAIPQLVANLKDKNGEASAAAAGALQMMDETAVDPLLALIDNESARVRNRATFTLGILAFRGHGAKRIFPVLKRKLSDESAEVRFTAAVRIAHQGPAEMKSSAVRVLVNRLNTTESGLDRINAVSALSRCGESGAKALIAAMESDDAKVRFRAAATLAQARERTSQTAQVRVLFEALSGDDGVRTSNAHSVLAHIPRVRLLEVVRTDKEQLVPLLQATKESTTHAPLYRQYAAKLLADLK